MSSVRIQSRKRIRLYHYICEKVGGPIPILEYLLLKEKFRIDDSTKMSVGRAMLHHYKVVVDKNESVIVMEDGSDILIAHALKTLIKEGLIPPRSNLPMPDEPLGYVEAIFPADTYELLEQYIRCGKVLPYEARYVMYWLTQVLKDEMGPFDPMYMQFKPQLTFV